MTAHRWGCLAAASTADPLMDAALDAVAGDVEYADVRLSEIEEVRSYRQRRAEPDSRREHSLGIGVRVLVDGTWGVASLPVQDSADPATAARRALAVARASVGHSRPVHLPAQPAAMGEHATQVGQDPFAVSEAERQRLLIELIDAMTGPAQVISAQACLNAKRQHRHFANAEGSRQHQHFMETGAMLMAVASDGDEVQRRTFPNSFHGDTAAAGWEHVDRLDLPGHAARIGEEAVALLTAPTAPAGVADLVIGQQQMSLQIHETSGHALELDRILGDEANFAGTSFITVEDVGRLQYGSDAVTIVSDPTIPGTRGSFAFDDEGTPAARSVLVDRGIVINTLSNRDAAARSGQRLTGAARADGWAYLPVCFSTHVFLEPGSGTLDELLQRLGDGYYIEDNRSWSIDNKRWNFQFGGEVAYEVRGGRRGRLMKNFSYGGITPEFWGSIEAVAGPEEFRAFGFPCGKGEPKQWSFLSHGAAPALARGIRIGVE